MEQSTEEQGRREAVTVSLEELKHCQPFGLIVLTTPSNISSSLCAIRIS